ncbi:MAG: response regulator [Xanthomonadales bacterium]|nr:response regulator [Xanthomonadales bacterium]
MSARVLIVEDEPKIAALLRDYLKAEGHDVRLCADGAAAEAAALDWPAELVLLDVRLPGRDGMTICAALRAKSRVPILMLTARIEEQDRLQGLDAGADDYVCKPFSPREVVARVRALLRRAGPQASAANPLANGLQLDPAALAAHWNGQHLPLTVVEFRLLATLAQRPGTVYTRTQLIDAAYTDWRDVSERTIDSHLRNLRRKLAQTGAPENLIEAVYGAGYRLGAAALRGA